MKIYGFMGSPGRKSLDLTVSSELLEDFPSLSEAQWRGLVSEWLDVAPGESRELTVLRFKQWLRRTRRAGHPRRRRMATGHTPRRPRPADPASLGGRPRLGSPEEREGIRRADRPAGERSLAERQLDAITRGMVHRDPEDFR